MNWGMRRLLPVSRTREEYESQLEKDVRRMKWISDLIFNTKTVTPQHASLARTGLMTGMFFNQNDNGEDDRTSALMSKLYHESRNAAIDIAVLCGFDGPLLVQDCMENKEGEWTRLQTWLKGKTGKQIRQAYYDRMEECGRNFRKQFESRLTGEAKLLREEDAKMDTHEGV